MFSSLEASPRGSFHNFHITWFKFDQTKCHAVEEVKSGTRTSVALFSPRSWKRTPPHALTELADVGFHPPISAMREVPEPEALQGEAEEEDIWMDSPPADQKKKFTNSPPEERQSCKNGAVKSMCHFRQTL